MREGGKVVYRCRVNKRKFWDRDDRDFGRMGERRDDLLKFGGNREEIGRVDLIEL